jgi:hypothetical protein
MGRSQALPIAYRCPVHGVIASDAFAVTLDQCGDPVCPEYVPLPSVNDTPARCGEPLTRHEVGGHTT